MSMTRPPSRRCSRQPSATLVAATQVAKAGRPSRIAKPFRWQRSSAASRSMKGGRQSGAKLARSAMVARQLKRVATKTGRPSASGVDVVDVDVAGGVAGDRHVDRVVAVLASRRDRGSSRSARAGRARTSRACRRARRRGPCSAEKVRSKIESRPSGLQADQEELAGLIGGEGEARAGLRQPGGEQPRAGQFEPRSIVHSLSWSVPGHRARKLPHGSRSTDDGSSVVRPAVANCRPRASTTTTTTTRGWRSTAAGDRPFQAAAAMASGRPSSHALMR